MAAVHTRPIEFHEGERKIRSLLHVPDEDNPTSPGLSPHATRLLRIASLLAIGTLDNNGQPWTTLLGGEPGFARSLGQSIIGVKTLADRKCDPVLAILLGKQQDSEIHEQGKDGRLMSALAIHLATRDRVKLWGKMIAGAFGPPDLGADELSEAPAEVQLVFAIQQSLGNCPKYLNKKQIIVRAPEPILLSESLPLPGSALELLAKADTFFITSHHEHTLGTNHRGGPPGFVRVAKNDAGGTVLVYPELSGNRLYQTLGNLYANPKAGLVIPDFDTGDVIYITGTTEIIVGRDAAVLLPRSSLVVKINVVAARFVKQGLAFCGERGERSPYNPPVRFLSTERALPDARTKNDKVIYASLLAREMLALKIARFRFSVNGSEAEGRWKPGQYVALSFEDELSIGYSHMREDDPQSLNDDYVRTFTVSSSPVGDLPDVEFEITIRNVGLATNFLFRQNIRAGLQLPLKGFGGNFTIEQGPKDIVPYIAGGIGITPLLAQLQKLDFKRIRLFWTVNVHDIGLVMDTVQRYPSLAPSSRFFVSRLNEVSPSESEKLVKRLRDLGSRVDARRILASDVEGLQYVASTWYLCTGPALRKDLLKWLSGEKTVYEEFNY